MRENTLIVTNILSRLLFMLLEKQVQIENLKLELKNEFMLINEPLQQIG